jgi:methionine-rich copper-binding protein CopC
LAQAAFRLQWQVRGADGKDAGNFFGALPLQAAGKIAAAKTSAPVAAQLPYLWNAPKPQSPEASLRVGFVAPQGGPDLLQTDFRNVGDHGGAAWTARLDGLKPGQRVACRFLGLNALPEGVALGLADSVTGHFEVWSPDAVYWVEGREGEANRDLRFFAGSREYVASKGLAFTAAYPTILELGNYPNPAQAFTVIRFAVPASISAKVPRVKLTVYNMQGQRIKTLADARLGAGRHSLRWDIRGEDGRHVAAGMYQLYLETDGKRISRALQIGGPR